MKVGRGCILYRNNKRYRVYFHRNIIYTNMTQDIINILKLFKNMINNEHIPDQELYISREDMKIMRSFFDHYNNGKHKIRYSQFFYTVYNMSIDQRIEPLKMAEIIAKTINNI